MKKNLLFIVDQLHRGGSQKVVANLSNQLEEHCNVHIAIYNDIDKVEFPYKGTLVKIKLPWSDNPSQNNVFARFTRLLYLIIDLRKIKKRYNIEVAISFLEASNIINILSHRKEKLFLSVRSYLSKELEGVKKLGIYRVLIKLLYNKADNIIVPSTLIKTDLIASFKVQEHRVSVIYNFIDIDKIHAQQQESIEYPEIERLINDNHVLVNVGRLDIPKGQSYLFPALAALKEKIPGIKFIIIGDGPLEGQLTQLALQSGLTVFSTEELKTGDLSGVGEYDICLMGKQENPFKYLKKNTVFVFPSLYEGFPNALLEAMACGVPCLSADCFSGPRELMAPQTDLHCRTEKVEYAPYGVLLPAAKGVSDIKILPDDTLTANWYQAIVDIFSDRERAAKYASAGKKRAIDYGKEIIIPQWLSLINEQ
jgi:glycosyltransferase involved in cell wall biosynthesis